MARKQRNTARSSHVYQAYRLEVFAAAPRCPECHCPHCHVCGRPVQMWRPYRNPLTGKVDGDSPSCDHIVPLDQGGHLLGPARVVHFSCNSSRGSDRKARFEDLKNPAKHF